MGLIVGGHPCMAAIDCLGGSAGGVPIDDRGFLQPENPMNRNWPPRLLPVGQTVEVRCFVTPNALIVECGDKEVFRWHGDPRRFTYEYHFRPPNYSTNDWEHLWLGDWDSEFIFHKLELKPLSEDELARINSSFTGVFPVSSQANLPLTKVSPPGTTSLQGKAGKIDDSVTPEVGDVLVFVNNNSGRCLTVDGEIIIQGPLVEDAGIKERWKLVKSDEFFRLLNE